MTFAPVIIVYGGKKIHGDVSGTHDCHFLENKIWTLRNEIKMEIERIPLAAKKRGGVILERHTLQPASEC